MASTSAFALSSTSFQWQINGLSSAFNPSNYIQAAVFNASFTNGQSSTPSGMISSTSAPSGGGDFFTPAVVVGGSTSAGNTYIFYGGMQAANGNWYTAGSDTFTSPTGGGGPPGPTRPSDWAWFNTMLAGMDFLVYAFDWDDFCFKINEFRSYKGLGAYSWYYNSTTITGDTFWASRFNECLDAMSGMGAIFFAGYVSSGGYAHAYDLLNIKDTLNSIS